MTENQSVGPFVLRTKRALTPDLPPESWQVYDPARQLWIDSRSDLPLVDSRSETPALSSPSRFGETNLTKTAEGADQEIACASLLASRFGETSITETKEGIDQPDISLCASQFGETSMSRTVEGVDQGESAWSEAFELTW